MNELIKTKYIVVAKDKEDEIYSSYEEMKKQYPHRDLIDCTTIDDAIKNQKVYCPGMFY